MTNTEAKLLAAYISRHSTRYIEPILHLQAYLDRVDRPQPLIPDLRVLLEMYFEA